MDTLKDPYSQNLNFWIVIPLTCFIAFLNYQYFYHIGTIVPTVQRIQQYFDSLHNPISITLFVVGAFIATWLFIMLTSIVASIIFIIQIQLVLPLSYIVEKIAYDRKQQSQSLSDTDKTAKELLDTQQEIISFKSQESSEPPKPPSIKAVIIQLFVGFLCFPLLYLNFFAPNFSFVDYSVGQITIYMLLHNLLFFAFLGITLVSIYFQKGIILLIMLLLPFISLYLMVFYYPFDNALMMLLVNSLYSNFLLLSMAMLFLLWIICMMSD
ncbi:hypothetical protein [Psychrobacter sp. I-STPA6b]|uniref:hypothetical protein n=1 Tax=Psychrobacter sp. I-STPA6b TaxID=2585718 RepID=UPI001D0C138E|nr:hypothetical protein [Psychrobacter sp. I-STPA6b]